MAKPTFWNHLSAALAGEVSAEPLEAYQRASLAVYEALESATERRDAARRAGKNAWEIEPAVQAELLCAWNAFVLQTLGDRLLEADYAATPATRGFVPPVTSDQILRFYQSVEGWLSRARQAHFNPDYKLDVAVPASLPSWTRATEYPPKYLRGLVEAMVAVRQHTEAALTFLVEAPAKNEAQTRDYNAIRQLQGLAITRARYAEDLLPSAPTPQLHRQVKEHAMSAVEHLFLLGQLLAMPELAPGTLQNEGGEQLAPPTTSKPTAAPAAPRAAPMPWYPEAINPIPGPPPEWFADGPMDAAGKESLQRWCLTHPEHVARLRQDAAAVQELDELWRRDPDPILTLEIQNQIEQAVQKGLIMLARDQSGALLGPYKSCPWAPVYQVLGPLTLHDTPLSPPQRFVFHVAAGAKGVPFTRTIRLGSFVPSGRRAGRPGKK